MKVTKDTIHADKVTVDPDPQQGLWWAQRFGLLSPDAAPTDLRTQLIMSIIQEATQQLK